MIREEQYFHYIVSSRLGVGSFGEVCKVKRLTDGKSFALKTLKDGIVKRNPRILQMLNHEVSGLLGKYHPNMVTMHDAFTIKGDFYLIYELCEPQSLKTRLKNGATWSEEGVIALARAMVKVLHFLHGFGILHRDIKPDNMLIKNGDYKLADFGLCYRGGSHYDNDLIGSPAYLAPEIFKKRYYSEKSDIYALGISLYELYIGKYPFDQKNEAALYKKKMEFVPNRENMPSATDQFITLLRMMCHPIENKRATIDELVIALEIQFDAINQAIQNHVSEFTEGAAPAQVYQQPSQYNHHAQIAVQQGFDQAQYQDPSAHIQQMPTSPDQFSNPISYQNNVFSPQDYLNVPATQPVGQREHFKGNYYDPWAITPTTTAPTSNTGSFSNEFPAAYTDYGASGNPQSSYNHMFDENMMRRVPYKNQPFMAVPDTGRPNQRSEHRPETNYGAGAYQIGAEYSNGQFGISRRGKDAIRDENTKPSYGAQFDIYAREQPHQMHRAYTLDDRAHKLHERSQSSHPQQKRFISSNRMNVGNFIDAGLQTNNFNHESERPAFEPIALNHRRDLLALPTAGYPDGRSGSRTRNAVVQVDEMSPNTSKKFSRYLRSNEEQPQYTKTESNLPFLPQNRTTSALTTPQPAHQNFLNFQFGDNGTVQPQRTSNYAGSLRTIVGSPNHPGSFLLSEQMTASPNISPMRGSPSFTSPASQSTHFFQQKTLQLQPVPAPGPATESRYVNSEAQNILNEINTFTEQIQPQRQRARQIFDESGFGGSRGRRFA